MALCLCRSETGAKQTLAEAQTQVEAKLKGYEKWAEKDERLVGLWPWHWTNRTKPQASGDCRNMGDQCCDEALGCEAMPGCAVRPPALCLTHPLLAPPVLARLLTRWRAVTAEPAAAARRESAQTLNPFCVFPPSSSSHTHQSRSPGGLLGAGPQSAVQLNLQREHTLHQPPLTHTELNQPGYRGRVGC